MLNIQKLKKEYFTLMTRSVIRKTILYTIVYTVSALLLIMCLSACDKKESSKEKKEVPESIADVGDSVYFCEDNSLFKFGKASGGASRIYTASNAKADSLSLILEKNGLIYLSCCLDDATEVIGFNLKSGEAEKLISFDGCSDVFILDGYAYYIRKVIEESDTDSDSGLYRMYLCRSQLSSGTESRLSSCRDSESIVSASESILLLKSGSKLSAFDTETNKKKTIFSLEDRGYTEYLSDIKSINGKAFFLCGSNKTKSSEYSGKVYKLPYLVCLDLKTGSSKKLISTPVYSFCLSESRLYYVPFELRTLYIPSNYKYNQKSIMETVSDNTLYSVNYDGSDVQSELSNINVEFSDEFTVIESSFYGKINEADDSTHKFVGPVFISWNLVSKEFIKSRSLGS